MALRMLAEQGAWVVLLFLCGLRLGDRACSAGVKQIPKRFYRYIAHLHHSYCPHTHSLQDLFSFTWLGISHCLEVRFKALSSQYPRGN